MKQSKTRKKIGVFLKRAVHLTALVLAAGLFTGCPQKIDGGPSSGGAQSGGNAGGGTGGTQNSGSVRLTIRGDERTAIAATGFIDVDKGKIWAEVKDKVVPKVSLKSGWNKNYYGVYEWRLTDENGTLITDTTAFNVDTAVYAVTNYTKFKTEGTVIKGYTGEKPKGKIILPAKNGENNITEIGANAFWECKDLGSVDLRRCTNLTTIGIQAFFMCANLRQVHLPLGAKLKTLDAAAFSQCKKLTQIILPEGLETLGRKSFHGCASLLNLSLPSSLKTIGAEAFYKCTGLTGTVRFPSGLTKIEYEAFEGCKNVGEFDFTLCSTTLISIKDEAFNGCSTAATYKVQPGSPIRNLLLNSRSGITSSQIIP